MVSLHLVRHALSDPSPARPSWEWALASTADTGAARLHALVAGVVGAPPDVDAWEQMRMPDHCRLGWPDRIEAPWGSWAT
ncbi:MAG: hypothetical protein M3O94_01920 [Actinomycetota bacterium]|nr:hypothetical protein [Actinomycetota bacterium]